MKQITEQDIQNIMYFLKTNYPNNVPTDTLAARNQAIQWIMDSRLRDEQANNTQTNEPNTDNTKADTQPSNYMFKMIFVICLISLAYQVCINIGYHLTFTMELANALWVNVSFPAVIACMCMPYAYNEKTEKYHFLPLLKIYMYNFFVMVIGLVAKAGSTYYSDFPTGIVWFITFCLVVIGVTSYVRMLMGVKTLVKA